MKLSWSDRYAAPFLRPAVFATAGFPASLAALIAAHRRFVASIIFFLPAALSLRFFGFVDSACEGSELCLSLANLARCARAIFLLTAALLFLRGFANSVVENASLLPPSNMLRSSAI